MKSYLINYADQSHHYAQKINIQSGLSVGGFDSVIECGRQHLDENFVSKNQHILEQTRGAGYWLWKPYIIHRVLQQLDEEDVLFYSDSGAEFVASAQPLVNLCTKSEHGVITFHMEPLDTNKEVLQTKRDAFILMDCDTEDYKTSWARLASFSVWRKTATSLAVVSDWLSYCQDERILTDIPNQLGQEDVRYIVHRHDQSVYSLITKKHGIKAYPDPSQWGNGHRGADSTYEQVINHTRFRQ